MRDWALATGGTFPLGVQYSTRRTNDSLPGPVWLRIPPIGQPFARLGERVG